MLATNHKKYAAEGEATNRPCESDLGTKSYSITLPAGGHRLNHLIEDASSLGHRDHR